MPFTESYGVYTDSNLTSEYSGFSDLVHETDQSDNPQDLGPFYIGSALESPISRTLEATSNPGTDQLTLSIVDVLPAWQASTAYEVGDCVQPTTPNGYRYECTTAGTTDSDEPDAGNSPANAWPESGIGSTITDGTVVWTLKGAKHETSEVKLALSSGGLDTATGGASLNLGTSISNGIANAVAVYIRVTNEVLNVSNNSNCPEIEIHINEVVETEA